jgi:hypothetical protein
MELKYSDILSYIGGGLGSEPFFDMAVASEKVRMLLSNQIKWFTKSITSSICGH